MFRFRIPHSEGWLPTLRERMRLDGKTRFVLLLVFFNALLIAILILSVYNREVQQRIRVVETQIRHQIERLATIQAVQERVVYITETPTPPGTAIVASTPTHTPTTWQPTETPTTIPSPVPSSTPTGTATSTRLPTRTATPTIQWTPTPSPSPAEPTSTPSPAELTPTDTATWTPIPTATPRASTPTPSPTPGPSVVTLTAVPSEIAADGSSTALLRAWVVTAAGDPVADGTRVLFATDRGAFGSTATTTAPTVGGVAEATLTSSTAAGVATVSAVAGSASASIALTFAPGPPYALALSASPTSLVADGSTTTLLAALVTDRFGNRVADGTEVSFVTAMGTLSQDHVLTSEGRAAATLASSTAGTASITASAGGASDTTSVYFAPWVQIRQTAHPSTAAAGSELTYAIVIENLSSGGDAALLDILRDQVPAGFLYVPGSTTSVAFGAEPSVRSHEIVWTATPRPYTLAAGNSVVTTFRLRAEAMPGTYESYATVDGRNFDPVASGASAAVALRGPEIASIEPTTGHNDAPVPVTIRGANFAPGAAASLGPWPLAVTWVSESTLSATVATHIAAGTYDLTVVSPGGASDTLDDAYTARNLALVDTTLTSGYLGTYGAEPVTSAASGDDDQIQVLFIEIPDTVGGLLYLRLFDPDCGGTLDIQNGGVWDTPFTFTLYGGPGTYSEDDARSAHPTTGVSSGTILSTAVFTQDSETDGDWYNLPLQVSAGEHIGSKRIFKLAVVGGPEPPFTTGIRYADLNLYNIVLSTSPDTNTLPAGARIFAFSWTYLIPAAEYRAPPRMFPYLDSSVETLWQHNWDYDNTGTAGITMTTPVRTIALPANAVSPDNEERHTAQSVATTERNTTWMVSCWAEPVWTPGDNLVTFWATDQHGAALAIFTQSTTEPPP